MPNQKPNSISTGSEKYDRFFLVAILSPSKTMDLQPLLKNTPMAWTEPSCDEQKTQRVIQVMKKHAEKLAVLRKLLNVSASLAETAQQYWNCMNDGSCTNDKPFEPKACGFAFDGVAYKGLDVQNLSTMSLSYLQNHLRIIDPLYGWLRPLDAIQPYRLEMASRRVFDDMSSNRTTKSSKGNDSNSQNLANFWRPSITKCLQQQEASIQKRAEGQALLLINLASDEYFAAIDWPPQKTVKIVFRHAERVVPVHAKRARGLMVRYMAQHNITSLEDLVKFNLEGYSFRPEQSLSLPFDPSSNKGDDDVSPVLVFDRHAGCEPAPKKRKI